MDFFQQAPAVTMTFLVACVLVAAFALYAFIFSPSSRTKTRSLFAVRYLVEGGKPVEVDVQRGLAIFGSAGSGKSKSGFLPIFKHCAENSISVINYDYKDFELTEMMNFFYKDSDMPVYNISPADPDFSNCINPIEPRYLNTFNDVNTIAAALIGNLSPTSGDNQIFSEIAESALAGVIQRTKEDYPQFSSLPYVCSILMTKSGSEVIDYIKKGQYAAILGKAYTDSSENERLFGSVQTTISNALRKIVSPEIFMIFGSSDFDLALNKPGSLGVLNLVNHPKYDTVLAPFLAVVIECALLQMSERDRNESLLIIDEASTIKLHKMERKPALLRSYKIGTIFGMQDKIQGVDVYGENKLKAILTNLGSKILGKANDADTAQYYEKLFEIIKETQVSISKGTGFAASADARENISQRERAKHRAQDFYKLQPGHFFIFDDKGESHNVKFKPLKYDPVKPKRLHNYSKTELELNFKQILETAKSLT